jgi:TonB family protein
MKPILCSLLLALCLFRAQAQNDTVFTWLDGKEKPAPEAQAVRYSLTTREGDHWKKVVFDKYDDLAVYGAYYSDAACTLFDGPYNSFHKNGTVDTKGRYVNNKKESFWRSYSDKGQLVDSAFYKNGFIQGISLRWYEDGKIQDSLVFETEGKGVCHGYWQDGSPRQSGPFVSGVKQGRWTYFYPGGPKCQEVQYQADSAISFTCYDLQGNVQTKDCYYEKEAEFKGGDQAWMKYLTGKLSTVVLPKAYYDGKIYGTVYLLFVVDTDGSLTGIRVEKSVDPDLDEIAKRIIRQSPKWVPAVQYNRRVKAYRRQPITFSKPE